MLQQEYFREISKIRSGGYLGHKDRRCLGRTSFVMLRKQWPPSSFCVLAWRMSLNPVSSRQCQPSLAYTYVRKRLIPMNRWKLSSIGFNTVLRPTFFCCRSLLCLQTKLMQSWVSQCCCWKWSHPNPLQVRTDSVLEICSLLQVAKESWLLWVQNRSESFSNMLPGPFLTCLYSYM